MIKLYDSNITYILPEVFAKDPDVIALGYALNKAIQRLIGYCQNIGIYNSIDTLPEQVLDLLAVELKTQYYDDTFSIELKRSLIKSTLNWYTYAGTAAAVTEMVEAVFGNGEIEEWFEYGGDPYHFKIKTSNTNSTDEMVRLVENLVKSVQNVRSQLESVIVELMQKMYIHIGCKVFVMDDVTLNCNTGNIVYEKTYLADEAGMELVDENGEKLYYQERKYI